MLDILGSLVALLMVGIMYVLMFIVIIVALGAGLALMIYVARAILLWMGVQ